MSTATMTAPAIAVLTPESLLDHWQAHRRLTRKTIEAFPEDQLFTFSIGGMRPFGLMIGELLALGAPGATGIATREWPAFSDAVQDLNKKELLTKWDEATAILDRVVPTIPAERFAEEDMAFGQWPGTGTSFLLYFIDNEIHHRAQGYVYLRALGVEPPAFWDR